MNPTLTRRQFSILGAVAGVGAISVAVAMRGRGQKLLKVEGSSALSPFMVAVARGFRRLHPGVEIDVRSTGDDAAVAALRAGTIDLVMLSRELRPTEGGLRAQRVAVDGVAMVVNADNHTRGMPPSAWQELFGGVKRDWPGFGGPAERVTLLVRAEGSAVRAMVHEHLHVARVMPEAVVVDGDARLIDRVSQDRGAVGYGSITVIHAAIRAGARVRMVPLEGVEPSVEGALAGSYPLRTNLSLVTSSDPSEAVRELVAYARGSVGQSLLRSSGYTPAA